MVKRNHLVAIGWLASAGLADQRVHGMVRIARQTGDFTEA